MRVPLYNEIVDTEQESSTINQDGKAENIMRVYNESAVRKYNEGCIMRVNIMREKI